MTDIGWYDLQGNNYLNKWVCEDENPHSHITFKLYDDVFDTLDWTKEPTEPYDLLLKERALQLRDEYDYIRLYYSSGSDSETCLQTFIKNNIPIDEIVVVHQGTANDLDKLESDREITRRAIPNLKTYETQLPNTKISILGTERDHFVKVFTHTDYREIAQVVHIKHMHYPSIAYHIFPKLQEIHFKTTKVCNLSPNLKPKLFLKNGIFYSNYNDSEVSSFLIGESNVFFFTDPSFPKLHLKQLHLLKNYFKSQFPLVKDAYVHESSVYKYLIEDATRVQIDRSVDFLKHDPNQKNTFTSGVTILKVREALKELYTLDRPLYDMFKNLSQNYLNKTLVIDVIKSKTYCLGS